jgi:MFS family permease
MRSLRTALGNAGLRHLLFAFVAASLGTWAFAILFALYAYAEGGATAVGLALVVRMLPSGFAASSLALLADRHPRRAVLVASAGLQALALAVVAIAVAFDAPFGLVLGLAALVTVAGSAYKPAQAALIPQLAQTPAEAAAANVAWNAVDYAGFLAGALLAGALAGPVGLSGGIAACALPYLACLGALVRLPRDQRPEPVGPQEVPSGLAELSAGLRTIWGHSEMRLLTGVFAANTLVQGTVDVLIVITAIELLGLGESGVGWLNSAWGVGGLAGGLVALALLGRGRLASGVGLGCVLAGVPLAVIGIWHEPAVAMALIVVLGVGYAVLETALLTLTQRLAPDDVLARVFGVQETLFVVGSATGGLTAAALVAAFGLTAALVVTGLVLPTLAVLLRARLGRLEAGAAVPERFYSLLRHLPMFAPLPIATIENLAARAETEEHPTGTEIIRQGDDGDRFYLVDEGTLDVVADGHLRASLGAGECVGEIALLRAQPRMATVRATTPVRLVVLDRSDFLAGVSAHARSTRAAELLASERLEEPTPAGQD